MTLEVELKFRVDSFEAILAQLGAMGVEAGPAVEETDLYFQHPQRDFAATDEALRIRRKAGRCFITYKGPKLDPRTKTRREIDLALPESPDTPAAFGELLLALGFRPVAEVFKRRRKAMAPWRGVRIEVSLDETPPLGLFVELELLAAPEAADAARDTILSLAEHLGLRHSERRSYLELLLAARAQGG